MKAGALSVGAVALLAAIGIAWQVDWGDTGSSATPGSPAQAQLPCHKVLGCIAVRTMDEAGRQCRPKIEQLAVFAPRWTHKAGDPIFTDYTWQRADRGTLTFMGKRAEFQDAGGRFAPVAYECDYDPATGQALDARVKTSQG